MTKTIESKSKKVLSQGSRTHIHQSPSEFDLLFWGVRGTLPSVGSEFTKYGGNTSCIEVQFPQLKDRKAFILDAGTGIVECGNNALKRGVREFHVFLTHTHYDHIIGLTRFAPLFRKDCKIHFYGQAKGRFSFKKIIHRFFSFPFFPIVFDNLPSKKNFRFHELKLKKSKENSKKVSGIKVSYNLLHHPQDSLAFRIWSPNLKKSFVYATDHEHGTSADQKLIEFTLDTDVFIFDSTYEDSSFEKFKGWGHSTSVQGAKIATMAKVGQYFIFHHDPEANDKHLENKILKSALKTFRKSRLAQEKSTFSVY